MYLLGYDLGSSSVKASLIEASTGICLGSSQYPETEMEIQAAKPGWAEQDPETWWNNIKVVSKKLLKETGVQPETIKSIGISYQMHGLVLVDKSNKILRPSIIWCDSRAVEIGENAFITIGKEKCLSAMLNSPGNFTASKLKWVKDNEPEIFKQIHKMMLPGDFVAMKLTGEICTTVSGLSEGIFWDFKNNSLSESIMEYYGFDKGIIPEIRPTFSEQGNLTGTAAAELGLVTGIPIAYRAGDQPNNAFSLNVVNPGEIAATAGTSGVVYGVSDEVRFDPQSRVNTFAHVNHASEFVRLGVLLCVNGTGILNSWVKRNFNNPEITYNQMNELAGKINTGSDGLIILPFGNGAERMLNNKDIGCVISNLNFNIHNNHHMVRAAQEGIVHAFKYGMDIMKQTGINPAIIRAGKSNMFLSPIFRDTLSTITGATIELYNTDGSQGASRGAGVGAGIYKSIDDAFIGLEKLETVKSGGVDKNLIIDSYTNWVEKLEKLINN